MKKLYIGTVKICKKNRVRECCKDGDTTFFSEIKTLYTKWGFPINNLSKTYKNQLLIGLGNDKYFWIIGNRMLGIKPTEENNIFVDKESLNLNLEDSTNTKKLIKTFKRRQLF